MNYIIYATACEHGKQYFKFKQPVTKDHTVWLYLYEMPRKGKFIETKNRSVDYWLSRLQAVILGRLTTSMYKVSFWDN